MKIEWGDPDYLRASPLSSAFSIRLLRSGVSCRSLYEPVSREEEGEKLKL